MRIQLKTESVAEFIAELRRLAMHCEFDAVLNDTLRDRLVVGLRSEGIQKKLLSQKTLTFAEACTMAKAMEAADSNSKLIHRGEGDAIHHVNVRRKYNNKPQPDASSNYYGKQPRPQSNKSASGKPCFRCGRTNHAAPDCHFIQATCNKCGKIGHISTVCRSAGKPRKPEQRSTNTVYAEGSSEAGDEEELHVFVLGRNSSKSAPLQCELKVQGKSLTMDIDTGAEVSLIAEDTYKEVLPELALSPSQVVLKTYTNQVIPVVGEATVTVQYGTATQQLRLVVVAGDGPSLLGRDWLQTLRLDWHSICEVNAEQPLGLEALLQKHASLFNDEVGSVNTHKANLHVRPDAVPKFHKARPVPFAIKDKIKQELDKLESDGIIRKVSHSQRQL